jgi:hypothetical protein
MELPLKNGLSELSLNELEVVDGGGFLGDVFEAINPINLLEFVYGVGEDLGASSVKFGRELYDFSQDVQDILGGN